MADPEGVLEEMRKRRGARPERVPPPRRQAGGEPRRPVAAVGSGSTATIEAEATPVAPSTTEGGAPDGDWGAAAPLPLRPRETPIPAAAPGAATLDPELASEPAAGVDPAAVPETRPQADTRGPVNVHARIQAPDNDRLERIMRQLRRMGWPTNKVEIIGMLVHELPEPADEALAERLLSYRRDVINATEAN